MNYFFPHVKYLSHPLGEILLLYYLGGELDINSRLTVGKLYNIRRTFFSETSEDQRTEVWICDGDDENKICQINLNNFGTKSDLRDKNINTILE